MAYSVPTFRKKSKVAYPRVKWRCYEVLWAKMDWNFCFKSTPTLRQSGPLTGLQLFLRVNCKLGLLGQTLVNVAPEAPQFPTLAPQNLVITKLRLRLRRFQLLLEFLYLWANDHPAVGLVRVGAVVILVVILALVELRQRHNFGDDGLGEMLLRLGF